MAAFGTDHDLMQRLLTVETRRESQRTLALTPLGTFVTLLIYLSLGAGLFTFYAQHPAPALSRPDEILPHFVQQVDAGRAARPHAGAIVLASDRLAARLAGRLVRDRHLPAAARARAASERHYLACRALAVLVFGVVLGVLACAFAFSGQMLWLVFKIAGVTSARSSASSCSGS